MTKTSWFGFCGPNLHGHQHGVCPRTRLSANGNRQRRVQTVLFTQESFRPPNPFQDSFRASTLENQVAAG